MSLKVYSSIIFELIQENKRLLEHTFVFLEVPHAARRSIGICRGLLSRAAAAVTVEETS